MPPGALFPGPTPTTNLAVTEFGSIRMTIVADRVDAVIGVDTHTDTHSAVVVSPVGAVLAHHQLTKHVTDQVRLIARSRRRCHDQVRLIAMSHGVSCRYRAPDHHASSWLCQYRTPDHEWCWLSWSAAGHEILGSTPDPDPDPRDTPFVARGCPERIPGADVPGEGRW